MAHARRAVWVREPLSLLVEKMLGSDQEKVPWTAPEGNDASSSHRKLALLADGQESRPTVVGTMPLGERSTDGHTAATNSSRGDLCRGDDVGVLESARPLGQIRGGGLPAGVDQFGLTG